MKANQLLVKKINNLVAKLDAVSNPQIFFNAVDRLDLVCCFLSTKLANPVNSLDESLKSKSLILFKKITKKVFYNFTKLLRS